MSTPQDPRNSGAEPEDNDTGNSGSGRGPQESEAAGREPGERFVTPSAPQPTNESGDEPADTSGQPERDAPTGADEHPTEYLPKLLQRDTGSGRTGDTGYTSGSAEPTGAGAPADDHPTHFMPKQPGEAGPSGGEAPQPDKGSAAFNHGWQPPGAEQGPGYYPGGEVPPQAWSAQPEEQSPGQAWQHQPPEQQPGYPSGSGAPPSPPGAYGGQQGWGGAPGEQQGWGGAPGEQQGWGGTPGEQQGWGGKGGQPQWGGQQQPGGYPQYPQQGYQPYGATRQPERSGPQILSIIGFVCAAVCLLFCPILFGPAGIILGIVGHTRGESLGKWAALTAAICMAVGLILAFLITGSDLMPTDYSSR